MGQLGEDPRALVAAISLWFDSGENVYAAFDDLQIVWPEARMFPLTVGGREIEP